MTSQEFSAQAHRQYEDYIKRHPEDELDNKWPAICGIMSAMAAAQIRAAANVTVEDTDTIELLGYNILIYENGIPSKVKASLKIPHNQWKKLLREMVQDWVGDDIDNWGAVDLVVDLGGLED